MDKINRKKFLQLFGSLVAGGSLLSVSRILLRRMFVIPKGILPASAESSLTANKEYVSPYKLVSSFKVHDTIEAFELFGERLVVATANSVSIYDRNGVLTNNFAVGSNLRYISADANLIYLLFPTRIEVYDEAGDLVREWTSCSDNSDYCSFTVTEGGVFVTDAANKNICKYTNEGQFVKFINSPNKFVIPSYTFGITCIDGVIYCSNSGRHLIESYTLDGEYLGSFGKAGMQGGRFCGCCNPVHLTKTSTGEIITSEKGLPRISCYGRDGEFRSVLIDNHTLGGGHRAYEVKVDGDKMLVAGQNKISIYKYDTSPIAKTACSVCGVSRCALREIRS